MNNIIVERIVLHYIMKKKFKRRNNYLMQ